MRTTLVMAAAILAAVLACSPRAQAGDVSVSVTVASPPVVVVPAPVYSPYGSPYGQAYGPGYAPYYAYPPPLVTFGTWWDPDYRAIRYNQYFQRYQPPPRIQGFTLR
jgi:hypothetical protein